MYPFHPEPQGWLFWSPASYSAIPVELRSSFTMLTFMFAEVPTVVLLFTDVHVATVVVVLKVAASLHPYPGTA